MSAAAQAIIRFAGAVPQFTVPDVVRTAEYYRDVLGFQISGYWRTPPVFAIVSRDQVECFFNRAEQSAVRTGRAPGAYDAYVHVTGVEALATELRTRGADILGLVLAFGEETSQRTT